jgi:hypothetical protein
MKSASVASISAGNALAFEEKCSGEGRQSESARAFSRQEYNVDIGTIVCLEISRIA